MTERYRKLQKLGIGTYNRVFHGIDTETQTEIVMKVFRNDQEEAEGLPASSIREISIFKDLCHVSIVSFLDIVRDSNGLIMIMEFVEHNLRSFLRSAQHPFNPDLIRSYAFQLLAGLTYLHHRGVVHCDIRPENILLTRTGLLKLCAFTHAQLWSADPGNSNVDFQTLCYQPPEMLIGVTVIPEKVDVWSAACVLAEIARLKILFLGDSEIDEFFEICRVMGTPALSEWPEFHSAAADRNWPIEETASTFLTLWDGAEPEFVDLLSQMLEMHPAKRPNPRDLLTHPYFNRIPERLREICVEE
jgi:serine/threonine protein kinase